VMSKEGSTISGLMDSFATAISIALQYGVPLKALVDKFSHMRFEPSGFTKNPNIPIAKSIMDYLFRWLATKFLDGDAQQEAGIIRDNGAEESADAKAEHKADHKVVQLSAAPRGGAPVASISSVTSLYQQDAPPCPDCGAIMIRSGACYKCLNCGAVSGCS
jgi:ribonucleoside-diphosphate reductase alpha chain